MSVQYRTLHIVLRPPPSGEIGLAATRDALMARRRAEGNIMPDLGFVSVLEVRWCSVDALMMDWFTEFAELFVLSGMSKPVMVFCLVCASYTLSLENYWTRAVMSLRRLYILLLGFSVRPPLLQIVSGDDYALPRTSQRSMQCVQYRHYVSCRLNTVA